MAAELDYLTSEEIAQSIKTSHLEQVYERALREAERIYEGERVRALRVQLLLLEDENDELRERIDENDVELNKAEDNNDELRQQVEEASEELQQVQMELKARMRDVEHYRTEVNALNASSSNVTKILAEKLALSRELAILKPELEHLKSQTTTQQNLLAEKLALQHELSSVQVELENEKRAVQRIKSQPKASSHNDSALAEEVKELEMEVAKAQREAQKSDRESRKKITEWESQKGILEGKLDAFRNKLRTTKEQLKEAQDEIEKVQAAKMAQSAELTKARLVGGAAAANPKKRRVTRFDPDMTIGTPGHGGPAAKKQRISVNVGEKSTFSMTPFLNRTTSILADTPEVDRQDEHDKADETMNQQIDAIVEEAAKPKAPESPVLQKKAASKEAAAPKTKQPLKQSTTSKTNAVVKKPSLPKVTEEEDED
jgi:septal ring factor EnvC (AmiA/AmiB activator)